MCSPDVSSLPWLCRYFQILQPLFFVTSSTIFLHVACFVFKFPCLVSSFSSWSEPCCIIVLYFVLRYMNSSNKGVVQFTLFSEVLHLGPCACFHTAATWQDVMLIHSSWVSEKLSFFPCECLSYVVNSTLVKTT